MKLSDKLTLIRRILSNDDNLASLNQELLEENRELNLRVEELSHDVDALNATINVLRSSLDDNVDKSKVARVPSKIVIAKYSLPINKERTHIAAFTKTDILFTTKSQFSLGEGYDQGFVLDGLHDKNLRAVVNEYGELFSFVCDNRNTHYISNIIVYDYLTLPQLLSIMDIPVEIGQKAVPVDLINAAVRYAIAADSNLFNQKMPRKRLILKK